MAINLQNLYLQIPLEHLEDVKRFTMTGQQQQGKKDRDYIPFNRYVDIWWLALCIGIQENSSTKLQANRWHNFILAGEILLSDPWRILQLQLLAVGVTKSTKILFEPTKKLISMANEYAATGLPILLQQVIGNKGIPIWTMTDFVSNRIGNE